MDVRAGGEVLRRPVLGAQTPICCLAWSLSCLSGPSSLLLRTPVLLVLGVATFLTIPLAAHLQLDHMLSSGVGTPTREFRRMQASPEHVSHHLLPPIGLLLKGHSEPAHPPECWLLLGLWGAASGEPVPGALGHPATPTRQREFHGDTGEADRDHIVFAVEWNFTRGPDFNMASSSTSCL